jgi:NAD(P)H-dependent FMN reductase
MSLKIGVIVSTTRPTRVGRKVADWFMDQVKNVSDIEFDLIDLAEENLPFMDEPQSPSSGQYEHERTKQWSKKISGYDGYVYVTAEYNHGYPAPLKNAIDSLFHEWAKKPVALVGYGGMGGARAIEQLVNVIAQVNGVALSSTSHTVRIIDVWSAFDEQGNMKPEFVKGHIDNLVKELKWWGEALKSARAKSS